MATEKQKRLVGGIKVSTGDTVQVRQVRSFIGRDKIFRDTLRALGLGRIGKARKIQVNGAVLGMIVAVQTVLQVEQAK